MLKKKILTKVKQLLRHIFLLIAILMTTTPAWAVATCHTETNRSFKTDASYKKGNLIKTTYYYYSTPKQTFVTITDNSYNTFSNISCKVTGDTEDGEQKFKIIYKTSSSESWNETNTEYILNRNWVSTGIISGHYEAGYTDINLSLPNNTTEIGIYFTNYNANGSGNTKHRTITISNVSVSFSNYFYSANNGNTLEAFPSTEKGGTCTTTRTFNYQYNNTITSVKWESNNSMFTILSSHTKDCSGEAAVTISFTPTEISQEIKGTITGTANTGQTITVYVVGSSWGKSDPTYQWNSSIWNNKNQTKTIYVGETINNIVSSDSKAECTYNIEYIEGGGTNNGDAQTTFTNNTLVAGRAGKYKLVISQPEHKMSETSIYNAGSDEIYVTINKHSIEANIAQTTAVWNELIDNAFTLTDNLTDYEVESKNPTIAQYLTENTIQTYYTSGEANFLITRPEDYKYNALNQPLKLFVNQNTNGCNLISGQTATTSNNDPGYSEEIKLNGIGNTLTFVYNLNGNAGAEHYLQPQYSTSESGDNFQDLGSSIMYKESTPVTVTTPYTIVEGTKRIRFKRTAGFTGNKYFVISNITVTRKQYITPSVAEGATLTLPTVAINQDCSATFDLSWSTCSNIVIESSNSKFTVTPSKISNADGSQTITVQCNTSEVGTYNGIITIYDQSSKKSFNVTATVNDKWTPVMTGQESYSKLVGDTWVADFAFQNTETEKPSADSNAPFYFEIDHQQFVNTDRSTRNPDHLDEIISYNQETNEITAHNAGTAVLTFIQKDTPGYYSGSRSCTITVAKHTPIFTWEDPVYFNQKISDYFTTDNRDTEITISQPSTDEDVAILYFDPENEEDKHTLDLTTYYKETTPLSSTQVTVSQAENWYWYAYEEPHTITPRNQDNHVTFTLTQDNYIRDFQVPGGFSDPWADSNGPTWTEGGIHFGQSGIGLGDGGWNWDDKYIIIEFTGIPDTLEFSTTATTGATTVTDDLFFYVSEGKRNANGEIDYTQTWEYKKADNNVKEKLNPDSRILKLCYTGNLEGWFKNVTVTELNIFEANPTELDFGANQVDKTDHPQKTFALHYANAGYKVTLTSTNDKFTVYPTEINTIGGEQYGTYAPITVTYNTDTEHLTNNEGSIIVTDECGHKTEVLVKGSTYKIPQSLYWTENWQAKEPAMRINSSATDVARSTNSTLSVTYKSSDESIINVTSDGTTLQALAKGSATITASQVGNDDWAPAESISKTFIVTDKIIQYIHWTDNLTRLLTTDNTIKLNAKIQINDTEGNRIDEPERTKLIEYYSVNESIVSVTEDGTLTIKGAGETYVVAYEVGNKEYEQVYLAMPVRVRVPSTGCTNYVLNRPDQIEFFQMNTNKIIKDEIELNPNMGIPGKLSFQHSGAKWASLFCTGSIKAQQKVNGKWSDIKGSEVTPSVDSWQECNNLILNENATSIRFVRPANGTGYHYVKDVLITPARYISSNLTEIDFDEIVVGSDETRTFTIVYSDMQSEYQLTTSDPQLTLLNNIIVNDCGAWGEETNSVTFKPNKVNDNYQETITIKDELGDITHTILVHAKIKKGNQTITWNPETTTLSASSDWREGYTKNATSSIGLPITYTIESNDYADFDTNGNLIIKKTGGSFIITANQDGDGNFNAATPVSIEFNIPSNISPIPTFIGGQEDNNWTNTLNWDFNRLPNATEEVCIKAPATLSTNATIAGITFATGDNEQIGSIHITSTGGLSVGAQGITGAATDGSSLTIDNLQTGAGFLRIDPAYTGTMPRITMRYQTKSTLDNGANKDATWQYIGAPGLNSTIYVDHNTWLYKLDEPQKDWVLQPQAANVNLQPFEGYAITQYGTPTYKWTADFTNQNCTIPLTYSKNGRSGRHIIANSYTAPINVAAFTGDEFQYLDGMDSKYRIEKTLYIYNSGSWNDWNENNGSNPESGNMSGQYYAIPVLAAQYLAEDDKEQTTIAPMQGIYLRVRSRKAVSKLPENGEQVGNLYLDYNSLVMGTNHEMNRPMRAPQKNISDAMLSENFRRIRILATSEKSGADRLYIIQDDINTRKYNNGYDAPNQETKGLVNIYTNESGGKMEVSCSNNIDSMYIGFMAGEDRTYTLHFSALVGNVLYLQDLMNGQEVRIVENGSYTFEAEPQSTNDKRFLLLTSSKLATDISDTHTANIWYSNSTLYITNALDNSTLVLYDASGHQVLSTTISHTPYTINLSYLAKGMYMARINNHVYKFVCK